MKKTICILMVCLLMGCSNNGTQQNNENNKYENAKRIVFEKNKASINGERIKEYGYVWSVDPGTGEEKYEGETPGDEDIYIAHDIIYYPNIDESMFVKENYDGEQEWVTYYTNQELSDYIFSTLPILGDNLPKEMMHSKQEAYNNPVLHINKAGEYILEGEWVGQVWIDLGEDAFSDETKKVTLIMNGVSIDCDVAPGVVFYNVYESDNNWEEKEEHSNSIDISDAGAKIILVDGKENNIGGANVYRMLKAEYKNEEKRTQKKRWKMDGALYSFESLLIESEENNTGILNVVGKTFEGIDSELHLCINGGYINVVSQDDGINVNEDDVSVFMMNNGRLTIFSAQGAEGDVIDSNGYIKINGGTILAATPSMSDDVLDSEKGSEVSEEATIISVGEQKGRMPMDRPNDFDPNNFPVHDPRAPEDWQGKEEPRDFQGREKPANIVE